MARHMIRSGFFQKASYDFNSIVALGQFVTLGMVLVASLSAIYSVVAEIEDSGKDVRDRAHDLKVQSAKSESLKADIDDIGEEVLLGASLSYTPVRTVDIDELLKKNETTYYEKKKTSEYKVLKEPKERKEKKVKKEKREKEKKKKDKKRTAIDDIFG